MDPNATLDLIRSLAIKLGNLSEAPDVDDVERLAEAALALDRWLSHGGFLPTDWRRDDASLDVSTAWRGAETLWGAGNVGEVSLVRRVRDGQALWCAVVTDRRSRETIDGAGPTPVAAVGELNVLLAARLRAAKR